MILYHAISTYQLLEMILYRLKNNQNEKSILMVTDTLFDKFSNIQECSMFFDEIWVYEINLNFPKNNTFQGVINNYFENFFVQHQVKIEEFSEIYAACMHYYFGHYLIDNNIKFTFFEDAAGMLSRPDILINLEKEKRPFKCKRNIEWGLYDGKNECIEKVVCNVLAQEKGVCETYKLVEDFNVINELMEITEDVKGKILSIFQLENRKIALENNTTILLTQHFANLGILSFQEQINIYKKFVDYFLDKRNILIKSHPDDVMFYKDILRNVDILKEKFPSEFLPLVMEKNIGEIVTISSTAIKNYYGTDYKVFELNTDFEKTYISIHKYYVALELCKYMKFSLELLCCDNNMMCSLILRNQNLEDLEIKEQAEVLCVDDYFELRFNEEHRNYDIDFLNYIEELLNSNKYKAVIFLNSRKKHTYFNKNREVFNHIIPVNITLTKEDSIWWDYKNNVTEKEQTFYVYSRDRDLSERIKAFNMVKELNSSEQTMSVKKLTDYERKAYEGQIKALEERLKFYIELNEKGECK